MQCETLCWLLSCYCYSLWRRQYVSLLGAFPCHLFWRQIILSLESNPFCLAECADPYYMAFNCLSLFLMGKLPLTLMEMICLVDYWQKKFIWLSMIQNPLMYLNSFFVHTHMSQRLLPVLYFPSSPSCLHHASPVHSYYSSLPADPLQTPCLKENESWKHVFMAKQDLWKQKFGFSPNKTSNACKYLNLKYRSALSLIRKWENLSTGFSGIG